MTASVELRPVPPARAAAPSAAELIIRFTRATRPSDIASIAVQLADVGDDGAVGPLLRRLGDRQVQALPELADSVCGALVSLGVMCTCGECSFAFRPRHLLAPEVVEMITELGPAVPMRYLIARQV